MTEISRIFIHGLDSSSQGTKATFFRAKYPDMIIEDFVGGLTDKMNQLERLLAGEKQLIIVGSSYGGLMATLYAFDHPERIRKLILLAPALTLPEFNPDISRRLEQPVLIYHGNHDELIPQEALATIAGRHFACLDFKLVDDDHSLHTTFHKLPWRNLLEYSAAFPG